MLCDTDHDSNGFAAILARTSTDRASVPKWRTHTRICEDKRRSSYQSQRCVDLEFRLHVHWKMVRVNKKRIQYWIIRFVGELFTTISVCVALVINGDFDSRDLSCLKFNFEI